VSSAWEIWAVYCILAAVAAGYSSIVLLILIYKAWSALRDCPDAISPGRAVGFLFIPFFNIYWIFRAVWGWAKEFNSCKADRTAATKAPEGTFLAFCILWVTASGIPRMVSSAEGAAGSPPVVSGGLAFLFEASCLVLGILVVDSFCRCLNAVAGLPEPMRTSTAPAAARPQGPEVLCPKCRSPLSAGDRFCWSCGAQLFPQEPQAAVCPDPACGYRNPADARFCGSCGRPLQQESRASSRVSKSREAVDTAAGMRVCPRCQHLNPISARNCLGCGAPLLDS
jgi:ribosomal protein L40E